MAELSVSVFAMLDLVEVSALRAVFSPPLFIKLFATVYLQKVLLSSDEFRMTLTLGKIGKSTVCHLHFAQGAKGF